MIRATDNALTIPDAGMRLLPKNEPVILPGGFIGRVRLERF